MVRGMRKLTLETEVEFWKRAYLREKAEGVVSPGEAASEADDAVEELRKRLPLPETKHDPSIV